MVVEGEGTRRRLRILLVVGTALVACSVRVGAQDIECDPGDREVRGLEFHGNHAFTDGELALRIVTTPSSWARRHFRFFGTRRCLDSDELLRDKYRLQVLYKNAGYYDATVDTVVTPAGRDQVRVAFTIDEGKPIRINSLSIIGLDSVPNRRDILRRLWVQVGKPYDQTRIALDADTIKARLRNSGYPQPDVLRSYQMRRDSLIARVELQVLPGPRARVSDVVVDVTPMSNRQQEISERVVRKLVGIGPGDLYREQALTEGQSNLYQTGAYRYVDVTPLPDSSKLYADSAVALKVTLLEDFMRDLSTEFGWATLDCFRSRMQIVDKNFLGGAQRLELTGQLSKLGFGKEVRSTAVQDALCSNLKTDPFSERVNYTVNATIRQPTLFGTWATPAFSLYRERRGEYKAYLRTTYIGGEASLLKVLRQNTSLRLSYNFEYGRTEADQSLLCAAFSRCDPVSLEEIQQARRLAILSAAVARARTDNPINPTTGYVLRGESRNSTTFIGSDPQVTFSKAVGDVAWYHPLGWGSVFAGRLRAGAIWGGANSNGTKQPPQQERLYAGGASSVRGFQQNELGPLLYVLDDTTNVRRVELPRAPGEDSTVFFTWSSNLSRRVVPVGGNSLFVANVDYRLRDPFLPDLLQYTLFVDVGSVWNRHTQSDFGGAKLYWTPGLGLRVFTPVGPIQINAGYNGYGTEKGQALFTPPRDVAEKGFTGVYCAVPVGTPPSEAPLARLDTTTREWVQTGTCPLTFQPPARNSLLRRLTFTFSIGPEF